MRLTVKSLRQMTVAVSVAMAAGSIACCSVSAEASHAGWPEIGHHRGHPDNESGIMRGWGGVHNELLGGDGNDTIYAGNDGDVIWGDSHAGDQPTTQRDLLYGGEGNDWLYASHGHNIIWTGAGNDHVALVYGYGTVYCNGSGHKTLVMRKLPQNRHWKLVGCTHAKIEPYAA